MLSNYHGASGHNAVNCISGCLHALNSTAWQHLLKYIQPAGNIYIYFSLICGISQNPTWLEPVSEPEICPIWSKLTEWHVFVPSLELGNKSIYQLSQPSEVASSAPGSGKAAKLSECVSCSQQISNDNTNLCTHPGRRTLTLCKGFYTSTV